MILSGMAATQTNASGTSPRIWASLHPFFEGGAILGRTVANTNFLRALLSADPFDAYHFFLSGPDAARSLHARLKAEFGEIEARGGFRCLTRLDLGKAIRQTPYHCFHLSDSVTGQPFLARLRNAYAPEIFPITGITHSLSYVSYAAKFLEHLWPGTTGRDAIVATSRAGKSAVEFFFSGLRKKYHLSEEGYPAPRVPVIPLGVTPMFAPNDTLHGSLRTLGRERLGADANTPVFLVFARLSHYSKMDLTPLLFAFQRAEALGLGSGKYLLAVAGQEAPGENVPAQLRALAANAGIRLEICLSPDDARKAELFAAADVFVSPVDNLQETFGITLIEAASAGLPVIASDFDGYRDTVLPGETGLLIPTIAPAKTPEQNIFAPLLGDNQYHLELSQQTVVDVEKLAAALARLGMIPSLRAQMSEKAAARCASHFTWPVVIEQWIDLWKNLWEIPVDTARLRALPHPLETDFGSVFAAYPTATLDEHSAPALYLRQSRKGRAVYREQDFPILYAGIEANVLLAALRRLLVAARKPAAVSDLRAHLLREDISASAADFLILWACKQDLLEFCGPDANTN